MKAMQKRFHLDRIDDCRSHYRYSSRHRPADVRRLHSPRQATEGYELLAGMKTPLVEAVASSSNAEACQTTAEWFKAAVKEGKYVEKVTPTGTGSTSCALEAKI